MADPCSNLQKTVKSKRPRTWVITSAIIAAIALLCFAHRKKIDQNLKRFMEFQKWDVYTHKKTTNLAYHFFQNRLCGIDFLIWDPKQAKKMHGLLQAKFGAGENLEDNGAKWDLDGITIISKSYSSVSSFVFRHQETWTQKEKYAKK